MKDIKPYWENYKNWECYKNKMYENRQDIEKIKKSYNILTSNNLYDFMKETTLKYKISTKVNFTNKMFNPISWLGQATCNNFENATSRETCMAWFDMSEEQKNKANSIAKNVINEWRDNFENI